jgi:CBS domain-containing protein
MEQARPAVYACGMALLDRARVLAAARAVLDNGGWCVLEACIDVPKQRWDTRLLICAEEPEDVADAIVGEILLEPERDARIRWCDRRTLRSDPAMGSHLCYVAATPATPEPIGPRRRRASTPRRTSMLVKDAMNPIVVSVGPSHNLREAARRMTARGVGAAVVLDNEAGGPTIITERDILHSNGVGQDIDAELVADHLTSELVYAAADWSLDQAADEMIRGGFRHVIVIDGSDVLGILSMRDIVRCWTAARRAGASAGAGAAAAES